MRRDCSWPATDYRSSYGFPAPVAKNTDDKADISVDNVHTPFGRTKRAHPAPARVNRSPSRESAPKPVESCCVRQPRP